MDSAIFISLGVFVAILAALVWLRARNSKFEIRPTDLAVAVLPVVIVLLVTGKIQKFEVGELKIETAFVKASGSVIAPQVTQLTGLPAEPLQIDPKRGIEEIPKLIEKHTEALLFRLGRGGYYYGPAIQEYLDKLIKYPFLRYIILENADGTFLGMADARELAVLFTATVRLPYTANDFANWLNRGDAAALKRLPGFEGSDMAISESIDKKQALQKMETLNVDTLPVINKEKRFVGVVNRSRLIASLIIEVADELKK
jgi:hypothetical protein